MQQTVFTKQFFNKQLLFIVLLYTARLLYCYAGYLKNYCWLDVGDESHIYLLGLSYYTTGNFPIWGPDVVYTNSHMAGGLQGLLIGGPLFIWHNPFAPYLFLFILESVSLIYLSRYVSLLFPKMPAWIIYSIIAFAPFAVHTGLKIINPAYVLVLSVPFTLSVMESLEVFEKKMIKPEWRFFWMGLGVASVFQLHPSYVIMVLLWGITMLYVLSKNIKSASTWFKAIVFSLTGFAIAFSAAIPAISQNGIGVLFQQGRNIDFNLNHVTDIGSVLFYFATLCGYEMNTFSPIYTWNSLWTNLSKPAALLFGILQITGFLVFAFQLIIFFLKGIKIFMAKHRRFLITIVLIIAGLGISYTFSFVRPGAHALIIFFPLSVIYMCFCLQFLIEKGFLKTKYIAIFFSLITLYYFSVTIVTTMLPDLGYREKAIKAIQSKNSALFEQPRAVKN